MSDVLLIHGSCHGAWCWDLVIPELEALGHRARAIDLPGNGARVPADDVSLGACARAIAAEIDGPVTLVGHSAGGFPITAAAEQAPDLIERLIYLCAYVPETGVSMADLRRRAKRQPLAGKIRVNPERTSYDFDTAHAVELLYHDVPPEVAQWAVDRLGPQPIAPQATPMWPDRANNIPRHYIRCADDRTIPTEAQREMVRDWPAQDVSELPTGHSPFLADPKGLAVRIDQIIRSACKVN